VFLGNIRHADAQSRPCPFRFGTRKSRFQLGDGSRPDVGERFEQCLNVPINILAFTNNDLFDQSWYRLNRLQFPKHVPGMYGGVPSGVVLIGKITGFLLARTMRYRIWSPPLERVDPTWLVG